MAPAALCWMCSIESNRLLFHHMSCIACTTPSLCDICLCLLAHLTFLCSIEMNMSYIYHAIYNYFSRDNVALPGLAKYFLDESHAEREHAQMLMDFQVRSSRLDASQDLC